MVAMREQAGQKKDMDAAAPNTQRMVLPVQNHCAASRRDDEATQCYVLNSPDANGHALAYIYSRDNETEAGRQSWGRGRGATGRCERRAAALGCQNLQNSPPTQCGAAGRVLS
jgi:hypothetical protein